jgi:diguanylate cyclase (GGDEF)-like protein
VLRGQLKAIRAAGTWRPGPTASRRSSVALGIVLVLVCLVAIAASRGMSKETAKAEVGAQASDLYQDSRFLVATQDAELRTYLETGDSEPRSAYAQASAGLTKALLAIESREDGPAIRQLVDQQRLYVAEIDKLLSLSDGGRAAQAADLHRLQTQPLLDQMTADLSTLEESHHLSSTAQLKAARTHAVTLKVGTPLVLGLVLLLLFGLWLVTRGYRRNVEDQSLHDALTGLPNRLLFADRATQALAAAARDAAEPVVIMIDLDRFKEVNDTLGHHHGDLLLIQMGARIAGVLRPGDTVARLGGDEFAVLLTAGGSAAGTGIAERISQALEPAFNLAGVPVSVEASMGIASAGPNGAGAALPLAERAAELLRYADMAMYDAKAERSGFAHYQPGGEDAPPARLALLGELREAMNRDELVLHYQPKVAADTGDLLGVEALVRWNHPTRGLLLPGDFIGLAEGTTLIQRLTTIVVDKALAMSRDWLDHGVKMPVAVNVSARCLLDVNLPAKIAAQLTAARVPANHLCVELTESTFMTDPDRALIVMHQLHDLGVRLSVDDFGTGYSSMAYLKVLPVDELKVDRSFVTHMNTSPDDTMLVQSAIDLGHNLGLTVVAEGVEDGPTLLALKDLGADVIQGYYLGRPMDALSLAQWIGARDQEHPETLGTTPQLV